MNFLTTTTESYISLFFTLALMLVLLYFMIYRPQKKQEKKDAAMRAALEIGDQVTTIGGIVGRVVAIKDDTFVLETGADRVKIRFIKNAIIIPLVMLKNIISHHRNCRGFRTVCSIKC